MHGQRAFAAKQRCMDFTRRRNLTAMEGGVSIALDGVFRRKTPITKIRKDADFG